MGIVGCAPAWGPAGDRTLLVESFTRCLLPTAAPGAGNSLEPDTLRLSPAGTSRRAWGRETEACAPADDLRRRGARPNELEALAGFAWRPFPAADQHVW